MDLKLEGVGHMDYCAQGLVLYVDDILDFIKYFTQIDDIRFQILRKKKSKKGKIQISEKSWVNC